METTTDVLLLRKAQAGDNQAFADLVSRHDERLRVVATRLLRNPDRVDDALQETYLKVFRNLGRFRGDSSVTTWLYRITYNVCLDELRKRPSAVTCEDFDAPCPHPGPAERTLPAIEAAGVLSGMVPEVRATVVLVHGYGYDYAAASEVLGVPAGTVASRLSRVRSRLRPVPARGEVTADAA